MNKSGFRTEFQNIRLPPYETGTLLLDREVQCISIRFRCRSSEDVAPVDITIRPKDESYRGITAYLIVPLVVYMLQCHTSHGMLEVKN